MLGLGQDVGLRLPIPPLSLPEREAVILTTSPDAAAADRDIHHSKNQTYPEFGTSVRKHNPYLTEQLDIQ